MRKKFSKIEHRFCRMFSPSTPNPLMKFSNQSKEAMVSTGLKAWQLGLIGGFSMSEIEFSKEID